MSRRWEEPPPPDAAGLLRRVAERLERFLDGEELAFETLGEEIEDQGFTADDLVSAILVLRRAAASLAAAGEPEPEPDATGEDAPAGARGRYAHRVASAEERELLSPEAWGYLIDLKQRGSLDDGQFERVLDILTRPIAGTGSQPAGVELAREVAARVALGGDGPNLMEGMHGEADPIH